MGIWVGEFLKQRKIFWEMSLFENENNRVIIWAEILGWVDRESGLVDGTLTVGMPSLVVLCRGACGRSQRDNATRDYIAQPI